MRIWGFSSEWLTLFKALLFSNNSLSVIFSFLIWGSYFLVLSSAAVMYHTVLARMCDTVHCDRETSVTQEEMDSLHFLGSPYFNVHTLSQNVKIGEQKKKISFCWQRDSIIVHVQLLLSPLSMLYAVVCHSRRLWVSEQDTHSAVPLRFFFSPVVRLSYSPSRKLLIHMQIGHLSAGRTFWIMSRMKRTARQEEMKERLFSAPLISL